MPQHLTEMIGLRFGRLVVIERAPDKTPGTPRYVCRCDCGTEKTVQGGNLRNGNVRSCGCITRESLIDLTGKRFGRLIVLSREGISTPTLWLCRCDCGSETVVYGSNLKKGNNTASCGCLRAEVTSKRSIRHGMRQTREYAAWAHIQNRCTNPRTPAWHRYGGRGIMCKFANFEEFYAEVGDRPKGTSIERIDNERHYEKGNVKWSTPTEQCNNRGSSRIITCGDKSQTLAQWARETGVKYATIAARIKCGWPIEEALWAPLQPPGVKGKGVNSTSHSRRDDSKACNTRSKVSRSQLRGEK